MVEKKNALGRKFSHGKMDKDSVKKSWSQIHKITSTHHIRVWISGSTYEIKMETEIKSRWRVQNP